MDIDESGVERLVSHKVLDSQKVSSVFIEMGTKGMAEGMAGDPVFPAEGLFVGPHMPHDIKRVNRPGRIRLLRKKPVVRAAIFKPVLGEDIRAFCERRA